MQTVHSLAALRTALAARPAPVLVATMGSLHAGHIALLARARALADGAPGTVPVVASIFVNRLQFGPSEDFDRYPRGLARDAALLEQAGCDLLFAPDEATMYPEPQTFRVRPDPDLAGRLEGEQRPGHFEGMATVVMKLFQMVQPSAATFGKKDYQQLLIVRRMVAQFAMPLAIEPVETVREPDGLALSSRNVNLGAAERAEAPRLNATLRWLAAQAEAAADPARLAALEAEAMARLAERGWTPGYVTLRRRSDLRPPGGGDGPGHLVALGAARLGTVRLIDNLEC